MEVGVYISDFPLAVFLREKGVTRPLDRAAGQVIVMAWNKAVLFCRLEMERGGGCLIYFPFPTGYFEPFRELLGDISFDLLAEVWRHAIGAFADMLAANRSITAEIIGDYLTVSNL